MKKSIATNAILSMAGLNARLALKIAWGYATTLDYKDCLESTLADLREDLRLARYAEITSAEWLKHSTRFEIACKRIFSERHQGKKD
jgi:hypothetical protein